MSSEVLPRKIFEKSAAKLQFSKHNGSVLETFSRLIDREQIHNSNTADKMKYDE
jgi:hypothetical protein